ncbi:helix-turn-helix domain-containing protein [Proteus mirabilis]
MSSQFNGLIPSNSLSSFNIEVIKELLLWIEVNLEKPLLLDDVAIKSGYTKWHLQRVFKQATGLTLASYIRGRRLTKAATELRLTKLPVLTIALRYQFDSQQSFTRRFKAVFGVTPSEYRKVDVLCSDNFQPPSILKLPTSLFQILSSYLKAFFMLFNTNTFALSRILANYMKIFVISFGMIFCCTLIKTLRKVVC